VVRARAQDTRERYGVLLLALVAVFVVEGVANPGPWQQFAVSVLLAATLLFALRVARVRRRFMRGATALAGVLVALSLVEAIAGDAQSLALKLANLLLVTLAPPAVVIGTLRLLRARNEVTIEAVLSVLCLYLLIGMFFAFLYAVIGRVDGSFFAQNAALTPAHYQYFSFVTLTTVGYGDLTANSNLGHTLSTSEALVGQIYLVTVVSLIVSNLSRGRRTRPNSEQ
jgi:hypothetical protein